MANGGKKERSSNLHKVGTLRLKPDDLDPSGVVVVGDKLVITDRKSDKVRVYRFHDGMLLSSTDELKSWPRGLCRVSDTELCIHDGIISIMSVQDSGLISRGKTFDLRSTFNWCHGVALWNDNIVVSGDKNNRICWCVVSLTDGRPDKLHNVCKGKHFSFLTVKQDMVYISCYDDSYEDRGVYGFNLLNPSQPTCTYKHKELRWPRGITVDDIGHLFVCDDWNPSIYHLTGNCELVAIYKNDIPRRPFAIFWENGVLYLTSSESNVITMYKTPQQGPAIPAKAMIKVDREDQKEKKQDSKVSPIRPVNSVDPVKQLTQTLSETGPAIPAKAMTKVDIEDQYEKKQDSKISPIRPVNSADPVKQVTQTLSETGIHESILMQLSKDLININWRFFFRALSVPNSEIDQIAIDYHNSGVWEQIYRLLCHSKDKGILNKASIIEALKMIERGDLVTKYTQETFPDS